MILKNNIEYRIEALEEKAKPPVISTLLDLIIWESEHKDDPEEVEVELSRSCRCWSKKRAKRMSSETKEGPGQG